MAQRRQLVLGAGLTPLVSSLAVLAQTTRKVWRVGFVASGFRPPDGAPPRPFRDELRTLGYTEGKDIVFEGRWAELHNERLAAMAAELLASKVDMIVAHGWAAATAVKQATASVPIVVVYAGDVVEARLVSNLAHPGGNVTGVNDQAAALSAKRLQLLRELVPSASRVAVLWNAGNYAMTLRYHEIQRAADVLRVDIVPLGVREPDDFDAALSSMNRQRPDALMLVTDALTNLNRQRIVDYAAAHQIPAMYEFGSVVHSGGLISYGTDETTNFKLAAQYIAKMIAGAKPGDLPVQQPNEYFLVINLKTAKALGLTIPPAVLVRAAELIE